jgi:DNA-binding NarL/FixJ family response regulator
MNTNETILIADDHELIRGGLRQILERNLFNNLLETGNGEEAYRLICDKKPVVAILDIQMPGMTGYEVAQKVYEEGLYTKVIFLTMHRDESLFNKAMNVDVRGYVLKDNTVIEIVQCLKMVLEGSYYLSPEISSFLVRRNFGSKSSRAGASASGKVGVSGQRDPLEQGLDQLTVAEKTILKKLAMMKTSQDIASELHVSVRTVQNHRGNICTKLGLQGAHALLKFAIDNAARI